MAPTGLTVMPDARGLPGPGVRVMRQDRLILVAIDDNDRAWYEMIIPFILSLRNTGYDGRLGVISYGLSAQKQILLLQEGLEIYPSAGVGMLACDRFLAAAQVIANDPELEALALYDADVWFPGPSLNLFEALSDETSLHVARDALFCTFITDPILPHAQALAEQCVSGVLSRFGGALQAGMILGARGAWDDFGAHILACLARVGTDFSITYGLDTTFLHLWAAQGRVVGGPVALNYVPKWGIHEHHDALGTGNLVLAHDGKPIEALHMTGDCRFNNSWRYLTRCPDQALALGRPFCLASKAPETEISVREFGQAAERFSSIGLGLKRLVGPSPVLGRSILMNEGLSLRTWGYLEIELVALGDLHMDLLSTFLNNQPSSVLSEILIEDTMMLRRVPSFDAALSLASGTRLTLRSLTLPGQACNSIWNFIVRQDPA